MVSRAICCLKRPHTSARDAGHTRRISAKAVVLLFGLRQRGRCLSSLFQLPWRSGPGPCPAPFLCGQRPARPEAGPSAPPGEPAGLGRAGRGEPGGPARLGLARGSRPADLLLARTRTEPGHRGGHVAAVAAARARRRRRPRLRLLALFPWEKRCWPPRARAAVRGLRRQEGTAAPRPPPAR